MSRWVKHSTVCNVDWKVLQTEDGQYTHEQVMKAIFLDMRAELQAMRADMASMASTLRCPNFQTVPRKLDQIARNTRKKRKPKAVAAPKLRVVR